MTAVISQTSTLSVEERPNLVAPTSQARNAVDISLMERNSALTAEASELDQTGSEKRLAFEVMMLEHDQRGGSVTSILAVIKNSPAGNELFSQAKRVQAKRLRSQLRVCLNSKIPFRGAWNPKTDTLFIHRNLSFKEKLQTFLFELTNIIQMPELESINKLAKKGNIDAHEYAMRVERTEYEGCQMISALFQRCIREEGWDPEMGLYNWESFDEYLEAQKSNGHFDTYLEKYNNLKVSLAQQAS